MLSDCLTIDCQLGVSQPLDLLIVKITDAYPCIKYETIWINVEYFKRGLEFFCVINMWVTDTVSDFMAFYRVVDGIEDNGHVFCFNVEDTSAKTSTVTSLGSETLNGNAILFLVYKSLTV